LSQSQQDKAKKISKRVAVDTLWRRGIVHWKLDSNQQYMREFIQANPNKIIVIASSRQLGKSFAMVNLAIETCLAEPNRIVKFIAPKTKDIRRIIAPIVRDMVLDCPKDLIPSFKTQESLYRFPNGSEIQLAGTDNGHAESIRGNKAHLCIIDEAGFCDDLAYIVNSILIPTTTTTGGKIVLASTPPKSPDHEFMQFMQKAEIDGRIIKRTIYDNPRLSEQDIAMIADAVGGVDSVDFKREYLVEPITSEDDAVVPEFTKELEEKIVRTWDKPGRFDTYVSMDIGVKDMTVVLFGYYDFKSAKIIVEDEIVLSGQRMLTDDLAAMIKSKEMALWTSPISGELMTPIRIADNNNLVLINDLNIKHGLPFAPTMKDNADAARNHMRMLLRNEQIIIHPNCKTLRFHLKSAIWDKQRKSYARSADKGHFDAIDALIYMTRNVNFNKNPYPVGYSFAAYETPIGMDYKKQEATTSAEKGFSEVFKVRKIGARLK
jgi:hypothetical protein